MFLKSLIFIIFTIAGNGYSSGLEDLLKMVKDSPEVAVYKDKLEAQGSKAGYADSLPDPMVFLGFDKNMVLYKNSFLNIKPSLMLEQQVIYPGKTRLASESVKIESEILEAERNNLIATKQTDLVRDYFTLFSLNKEFNLNEKMKSYLEITKNVAQALMQRNLTEQVDVLKISADILSIIEKNRMVQGRIEETKVKIRIKDLGLTNVAFSIDIPSEIDLPLLKTADELQEKTETSSPMFSIIRSEIRLMENMAESAEKESYPDFAFSAEIMDFDMWGLKAGISIPLYYKNKQKNMEASANSNKKASYKRLEAVKVATRSEITEKLTNASTIRENIIFFKEQLIPQSELVLEAALTSYQTGRTHFLMVMDSIDKLINARMKYYELIADYMKMYWDLEILSTGGL